ncbi:MAG: hypothetical protein ACKOUQ_10505, partial [Aquirufa sp.]
QQHHFIVIAPEFSAKEFPGNDNYSLGSMKDGKGGDTSSFSFIEPIFDLAKSCTGNRSERYFLFGHSAGAQFDLIRWKKFYVLDGNS